MSKERPDYDKMANELHGKSAFFKRPTPPPTSDLAFVPDPSVDPVPVETAAAATPPVDDQAPKRRDVVTSRSHDATAAYRPSESLDINQPTTSHDTLRLASDETRALESLKSTLKWEYDLTVSKNDICRVALHELIEDYRAKGATSAAVKRLKKKQRSLDINKS